MKVELRKLRFLLWAALREIFDESAYARFLERERLAASPHSYQLFWKERAVEQPRRTRCC